MKSRLPVILAALALAAVARAFPIAGVIVDAQSGSPLRRARIVLTPAKSGSTPMSLVVGDAGRFSFEVPDGRYSLAAEYRGVRQIFGLQGPGLGFGVSIITGADHDTGHLTFRWFAPGAITGTVVDDRGEPVEGALVQLIRSMVAAGRKRLVTAGWFWTDDRGVYRFGPVTGGTYYLAVTGAPWYVGQAALPRMPDQPSEPTAAYAPNYYPGASDLAGASPVILEAGGEVRADFTLRTTTGVRVIVNCPNAEGRSGMLSLVADGVEGPAGFQRQLNFYGMRQTIPAVPPGRYQVHLAGGGENPFSARKTIDVASTDVTVELALQPPPSVSGRVVFANPAARPKSTVYVRLIDEVDGPLRARAVETDGSFVFDSVAASKFRAQITHAEGFSIARISADGATLKNGVLDVVDGAKVTLSIFADDDTGQVKGFVMNGDDPVPGVLAVLAPRKESTDPGDYRGYQTDSDGSFSWANIPTGDYMLFAVARLDLEYANAAAIGPHLAGGKPIRVERHGTYDERVAVAAPAPRN
jgi:hypothetical protein